MITKVALLVTQLNLEKENIHTDLDSEETKPIKKEKKNEQK